jgi:hypothetical protein
MDVSLMAKPTPPVIAPMAMTDEIRAEMARWEAANPRTPERGAGAQYGAALGAAAASNALFYGLFVAGLILVFATRK